jgi:hypothetical protein
MGKRNTLLYGTVIVLLIVKQNIILIILNIIHLTCSVMVYSIALILQMTIRAQKV